MCGFVGVIDRADAAPQVYLALQALQHRGQDAAGIGSYGPDGRLHVHKDLGLIPQAIPVAALPRLPGVAAVGHVRYPTAGSTLADREDAQPFITRRPALLVAHNGNVTNMPALHHSLRQSGLRVMSTSDSEAILLVLAEELTEVRGSGHSIDDLGVALGRLMRRIRGAYAVCALMELDDRPALVAFRDPHGIRPCAYGRHAETGAWMVASESVALDALGYTLVEQVPPGAFVVLRAGQDPVVRAVRHEAAHPCVFERIYFARPDSMMEEGRVNAVRWALGERLADEWKAKGLAADVVVAVPDTSRDAAQAIAERLGLPHREGFIKNRYSGRTFIMPDQASRDVALRLKLNPIPEVFEGNRVILVDDSIVRGSTARRLVAMVKTLRPAEVHLAIFSPPVAHPCFYGIDMASRDELVAARFAPQTHERDFADELGVASLTHVSVEGLGAVIGARACAACFTGDYPVQVDPSERAFLLKNRASSPPPIGAPAPTIQ